jgi:threonine/homoserine/homoserine lactone efflux protein
VTITASELGLYAFALFVLFMTPGPVWAAITARALSGGLQAAWPLALGVMIGDVLWPLAAIFGLSWITSVYAGFMEALRWVAVAMFVGMGLLILRKADTPVSSSSALTRPGMLAGFMAGVVVILANPKAILFYMGILPGFFDLNAVGAADIFAICLISLTVPFIGNLLFAASVDRARRFLASGRAVRRANIVAGSLMLLVGAAIAFG